MNDQKDEKYVTPKELCSHFAFSDWFMRKCLKLGMPYLKVGRDYRFRISEVENWLKEQEKRNG